ncbi:uncharacterized protein MKK02DRAFT_28775 [Dioszegia hungarica]|uniref:Uncharacterized protein n=1 Tax=Dioszegia hungarica TaxID=4972 RepID=A0AA38H557_9TREE|nr:uncharacterized protein MKK02DRAFT_28775 [Dioszegia hungarica]KAI9634070.1 hypothetical protein MKK02DRAFT_28775 [Dioszegia hungarica]
MEDAGDERWGSWRVDEKQRGGDIIRQLCSDPLASFTFFDNWATSYPPILPFDLCFVAFTLRHPARPSPKMLFLPLQPCDSSPLTPADRDILNQYRSVIHVRPSTSSAHDRLTLATSSSASIKEPTDRQFSVFDCIDPRVLHSSPSPVSTWSTTTATTLNGSYTQLSAVLPTTRGPIPPTASMVESSLDDVDTASESDSEEEYLPELVPKSTQTSLRQAAIIIERAATPLLKVEGGGAAVPQGQTAPGPARKTILRGLKTRPSPYSPVKPSATPKTGCDTAPPAPARSAIRVALPTPSATPSAKPGRSTGAFTPTVAEGRQRRTTSSSPEKINAAMAPTPSPTPPRSVRRRRNPIYTPTPPPSFDAPASSASPEGDDDGEYEGSPAPTAATKRKRAQAGRDSEKRGPQNQRAQQRYREKSSTINGVSREAMALSAAMLDFLAPCPALKHLRKELTRFTAVIKDADGPKGLQTVAYDQKVRDLKTQLSDKFGKA